MKEIKTKFGTIYIEEWEFDRHKPCQREEEDRVKIFDSNERYLDYFSADSIEENAEYDNITPQELLDKYASDFANIETIEEFLDELGIEYDLITKDRVEVVNYLLDFNVDDDSDIEENECVNKIGDYYIVVSEY